jgi:hypothetical protein
MRAFKDTEKEHKLGFSDSLATRLFDIGPGKSIMERYTVPTKSDILK